jgi:hypothetical protein
MTSVIEEKRVGRALISDELFGRLTKRIAKDHPEIAPDLVERIMDQALAFLGACAVTRRPVTPSDLVDIGWHTFILYTRPYTEFCDRIAGRYIHHEPHESKHPPVDGGPLRATVEAIRAAGYTIDPELWGDTAACRGGQ